MRPLEFKGGDLTRLRPLRNATLPLHELRTRGHVRNLLASEQSMLAYVPSPEAKRALAARNSLTPWLSSRKV